MSPTESGFPEPLRVSFFLSGTRRTGTGTMGEHERQLAAWAASRFVADLCGWATHPHPESLTGDWATAYKQQLGGNVRRLSETYGDSCPQVRLMQKLALRFIGLMIDRPKLSTFPVEEWPVRSHRQLYDDFSAVGRHWEVLSEPADIPDEPVAAEADVPQKKQLGHLGHSEIILPTDPDVSDVWNAVQAAADGTANVSEICRKVAEKSGANAESLRKKYNRWKEKNIG